MPEVFAALKLLHKSAGDFLVWLAVVLLYSHAAILAFLRRFILRTLSAAYRLYHRREVLGSERWVRA